MYKQHKKGEEKSEQSCKEGKEFWVDKDLARELEKIGQQEVKIMRQNAEKIEEFERDERAEEEKPIPAETAAETPPEPVPPLPLPEQYSAHLKQYFHPPENKM